MNKTLLSFLGITRRSGNLVFGMDEVIKNIAKGNIKLILTAKDVSENSFEKVNEFKNRSNPELPIMPMEITKEEIFRSTNKFAGIIGIKDQNFADKISLLVKSISKGMNDNDKIQSPRRC